MAKEKSMAIGMIISLILTGLGLVYAGDSKKGIIIFVAAIIFNIIAMYTSPYVYIISIIIWIYGLYATYNYIKLINA